MSSNPLQAVGHITEVSDPRQRERTSQSYFEDTIEGETRVILDVETFYFSPVVSDVV